MRECWHVNRRNRPTFANLERDLRNLIQVLEEQPDPNQPVASEIYVPASIHSTPSSASTSGTTKSDSEMQLLPLDDLSEEAGPSMEIFEV